MMHLALLFIVGGLRHPRHKHASETELKRYDACDIHEMQTACNFPMCFVAYFDRSSPGEFAQPDIWFLAGFPLVPLRRLSGKWLAVGASVPHLPLNRWFNHASDRGQRTFV